MAYYVLPGIRRIEITVLNIALVRKDFSCSSGGAEGYAISLAEGLAKKDNIVHVFASNINLRNYSKKIVIHKVSLIKTPSPLKNLSFQRNTRSLLSGSKFDIVNGLSQVYPQDIYRAGDGLHIHWLKTESPNPRKRFFKFFNPRHLVILFIERNIFKPHNYLKIIANSNLCKRQISYYYRVPENRIVTIYNGVDTKIFNPSVSNDIKQKIRSELGLSRKDFVLLFSGNNFRRKGLQFCLQILSLLKNKKTRVKLIVCGRDNLRVYKTLCKTLNLSEDVIFPGYVSNMFAFYNIADMLIHPTLYEPFSNVCMEAMASYLPVITTRLNGAHEIIEDGVSGLVFDFPWEVKKMVVKIEELINNRAKLQQMAFHAGKTGLKYPLNENIDRTVAVYNEVINQKKSSL